MFIELYFFLIIHIVQSFIRSGIYMNLNLVLERVISARADNLFLINIISQTTQN